LCLKALSPQAKTLLHAGSKQCVPVLFAAGFGIALVTHGQSEGGSVARRPPGTIDGGKTADESTTRRDADRAPGNDAGSSVQSPQSERWARLRTTAGLTQGQPAERSGVSQPQISQLERTAQEPRLSTVLALSRAVRVEPATLLQGTNSLE
jgi:DNA-binding XRE family transcriptional regulator